MSHIIVKIYALILKMCIRDRYYVMSPSEITDDLRNQAADDYAKFMTADSYKTYTKAYNVFIKKNPGYEEKIANKLDAE